MPITFTKSVQDLIDNQEEKLPVVKKVTPKGSLTHEEFIEKLDSALEKRRNGGALLGETVEEVSDLVDRYKK